MPTQKTKKTTTSDEKKPATEKATTVVVKEKAVKQESCTSNSSCDKKKACMILILLGINTILLWLIAFKMTSHKALFGAMEEFEAMRVGGVENHNIMKEIYGLNAYKNDQKMRLETTLNALNQMETQAAATAPETIENTQATE